MPTTLPITRALALLLVGPLLASACAAGDGDEEADPAGQADVAVSVVDADGSGDDADGAASGEVVADSADRAGGGGADGGGPNSGGGADGTVLDLTSPQTVSGRIEVALAADRYTFQAEPGEKLSVQIDANSQAGCRDET